MTATLTERFGLPSSPATVLDVGAASGAVSRALADEGHVPFAVELEPALASKAHESGVRICVGDGNRLPARDGSVDAAVLIEVFEHVDDPTTLVTEIGRVVRPGGRLCVAVPTGYTEAVYWRLHPEYAANAGHVRRYRKRHVTRVLEQAGFEVVDVRSENFVPALSWLFHALLRSRSDQTGAIHDHAWVDRALRIVIGTWRRTPVLRSALRFLESRVGKSWYFVGVRR
jgi:SAM-dependent methyltransferase